MPKKKIDTTHHMGKHTGYHLIDGVYHIAPAYSIQFDDLLAQWEGVDDMLGCVTRHAAKELEALAKQRIRIWDELLDDLGLKLADGPWEYYRDGTIKKREAKS